MRLVIMQCAVWATLVVWAPAVAENLVTNGDFELPAIGGDGDFYSTDAAFSLPGWLYPTASNSFFLEYGAPWGGITRTFEGRQFVCINGDGTPYSISQTLATVPGQLYHLTFAFGEEQLGRPSPTKLRVEFGEVVQDCTLGPVPKRYAVFSLYCTALTTETILRFTDLTSSWERFRSPFLDAISVVAVCPSSIPGDLNDDCQVNFEDFALLARAWLVQASCPPYLLGDINTDSVVDMEDLVILTENWLAN